jgi:transposase-like protein
MSKYNNEIVAKICQLIESDSYTISEICEHVGINEATFYRWKEKKSDFCEAIKKAGNRFNEAMIVDAKRSLRKLVKGYTYSEEKTVTIPGKKKVEPGEPQELIKQTTITEKHVPPNTVAIIFTLVNRDPDNWKNRQDTAISGEMTLISELEKLSDKELESIIKNGGDTE